MDKQTRSKTTEQKRREIIVMSLAGYTPDDIAKKLGYKFPSSITTYLKSIGASCIWKEVKRQSMREYKAEGHTHLEVAEKYGVGKQAAMNVCKGIASQSSRRPKDLKNQYMTDEGKAIVLGKLIKRCEELGFEYVDGYTGSEGFCNVRCMKCGTVYKKSCISIRHADQFLVCENCNEINKRNREEEKRKASEAAEREYQRRRWLSMKATQLSIKECRECGSGFVSTSRSIYCSDECQKKASNRAGYDKRIKRLSNIVVDKDISLEKLSRRDNGICWLCGRYVDWMDIEVRDGTKIAGDMYPSIDHVVPISKGGKHSWDNIKLAHRICNTLKGDKDISLPVA